MSPALSDFLCSPHCVSRPLPSVENQIAFRRVFKVGSLSYCRKAAMGGDPGPKAGRNAFETATSKPRKSSMVELRV